MPYIHIGGPASKPVVLAPHSDKIATDTGWKTVEAGNCYFKNKRTVVFQESATEQEVNEFAAFEKAKMYGQLKIAEVNGKTVTLIHAVDSGG